MPHSDQSPIKLRKGIFLLPNLFTVLGLFFGFYAIVAAMQQRFDSAAIAIYIAMILDALDGRIARMTNTQTAFGGELDSLSDMVSFGLAPALVVYHWGLIDLGKLGWLAAFTYVVCGALRLARFNTQHGKHNPRYFQGLPIPAAAGFIAGLVWVSNIHDLQQFPFIYPCYGILVVIIGLLMVSTIRYRSFKDFNLKGYVPFLMIVVIALILVLIAFDPPHVVFAIFALYVLSGVVTWIWRYWHLRRVRRRRGSSQ